MATYPPAVHAMADHVWNCLQAHRTRSFSQPLFVGVQGPQGSGKTFLTSRLRLLLADPPYSLSVAVLSIDDLYLSHAGLVALAEAYPHNRLLHGRGQPGTHDVSLGTHVLHALKAINNGEGASAGAGAGAGGGEVALPVFDKSLCEGEGDRVESRAVHAPVDVVVLEGWCVGFYPVDEAVVEERWRPDVGASLEEVHEVNGMLRAYVGWWDALDAFVQIRGPASEGLAIVYRWRLQQERGMKAKNGGRGMTDEQVKTFVDRYIPGYVFFGDGVEKGMGGRLPPWNGRGLAIELDLDRNLQGTRRF